jgi:carbon monoxide dehydrogenase subunit G
MELNDEVFLPLPRERVWAALNDPKILQASVPGCESLEPTEDNKFKVVLAASVGPIKARFNGRLELHDLQAPVGYSLSFEGSGGAAGHAKGTAKVELEPQENGTRLIYRTQAQVGGRLAQVGARLIDGVAKKMAGEFFARFTQAAIAGEPAAVSAPVAAPVAAPATAPASQAAAATAAPAEPVSAAGAAGQAAVPPATTLAARAPANDETGQLVAVLKTMNDNLSRLAHNSATKAGSSGSNVLWALVPIAAVLGYVVGHMH